MEENYSKPFKTYEEQLKILKNRYKLNISDDKFALKLLKTVSYYDLINGSKECFFKENEEIFEEGVDINHLFSFKILDRNIQNILFKYSVYVENTFKTNLAYTLAKNYGIEIEKYLDENNFKIFSNSDRMDKRNKTLEIIKEAQFLENNPTFHYKKNHNHIPPWILFKNVNFTDSIDLFTFFKRKDKLEIVKEYFEQDIQNNEADEMIELLKTTISIVRKFRNKIAHNAKVITYKTENRITLKNLIPNIPSNFIYRTDYRNNIGINDLFAMISSLILLLNNDVLALHLSQELRVVFDTTNKLNALLIEKYKKVTNLPNDIEKRLDKLIMEFNKRLDI
jgi:hypothetical protein|nr:MAG TPA: Abi-like protein [Caudoviricetes sp.]